jgi:hypothetical protein
MPELPRLACDALRVARSPNGGQHVSTRALDDEGARAEIGSRRVMHRLRLAGQDRLVEQEPFARPELPVGDQLISGLEDDEVAFNDLVLRERPGVSVAHDGRCGNNQRREAVEGPLRPYFLDDPDQRVRHQDSQE